MNKKIAVCVLACGSLAVAGYAQQSPPPIPKPGPEHELLKQDVGTWDATVEIFEPGKPPAVSKGSETTSLVGGFWAVSDFKSDLMGQPFEGRGTVGFDTNKKKYVSTWVDSMSTGFMTGEATYDSKTKTMTGFMEGFDPAQGKTVKMRETTEWKDADTKVFTMFMTGPDGKEVQTMKITYKRRK
jgi:Protein of unknown function (DUF1579)